MRHFFLLMMVLILSSCRLDSVREKDLPLLQEEAAVGNLRAKRALVITPLKSGIPNKTLNSYKKDLLAVGDEAIIKREIGIFGLDTEDEAEDMKWVIYGAEHGNSDYMVQLGEYYREARHPDQKKATYWYRRAADSLNYDARMAWIKWRDGEQLLDRPSRAFEEQWKVKTMDYSIIGRVSCSISSFCWKFFVGTFSVLFSKNWWQGIIGLIVLLLGLALLIGVFPLASNYVEDVGFPTCLPIIISSLFGIINGFADFIDEGYNIGRFGREIGMYGTISDICVYSTWIWAVGTLFTLAIGCIMVSSKNKNIIGYVLFSIGGSIICYIASMMAVVAFMILFVIACAGLIYCGAQYRPNNAIIKGGGSGGKDLKASKLSNGMIIDENGDQWNEEYNDKVRKS